MSVTELSLLPTLYHRYRVAKDVLGKISIWNGDITRLEIDAIVNAANSRLAGGGGVDHAIHRAAGTRLLQRECLEIGHCDVGEAVITSACDIKHAKNIIHTVGPQVYSSNVSDENRDLLINCYRNSLELAVKNNLKTIAFCCISTGVYGYPNDKAASHVSRFLIKWLSKSPNRDKISRIVIVTFLPVDADLYNSYFKHYAEKKLEELENEKKENTANKDEKEEHEEEL